MLCVTVISVLLGFFSAFFIPGYALRATLETSSGIQELFKLCDERKFAAVYRLMTLTNCIFVFVYKRLISTEQLWYALSVSTLSLLLIPYVDNLFVHFLLTFLLLWAGSVMLLSSSQVSGVMELDDIGFNLGVAFGVILHLTFGEIRLCAAVAFFLSGVAYIVFCVHVGRLERFRDGLDGYMPIDTRQKDRYCRVEWTSVLRDELALCLFVFAINFFGAMLILDYNENYLPITLLMQLRFKNTHIKKSIVHGMVALLAVCSIAYVLWRHPLVCLAHAVFLGLTGCAFRNHVLDWFDSRDVCVGNTMCFVTLVCGLACLGIDTK